MSLKVPYCFLPCNRISCKTAVSNLSPATGERSLELNLVTKLGNLVNEGIIDFMTVQAAARFITTLTLQTIKSSKSDHPLSSAALLSSSSESVSQCNVQQSGPIQFKAQCA
jgi:hypothetical protein